MVYACNTMYYVYIRILSNTNQNIIILHNNIFQVAAVEQKIVPGPAGAGTQARNVLSIKRYLRIFASIFFYMLYYSCEFAL